MRCNPCELDFAVFPLLPQFPTSTLPVSGRHSNLCFASSSAAFRMATNVRANSENAGVLNGLKFQMEHSGCLEYNTAASWRRIVQRMIRVLRKCLSA